MNEDELARLLRATPDEPDLPADPLAAVRGKGVAIRRRKQMAAGTLAVAVLAAAGGVALSLPGSRAGGSAVVQEATDPPTASLTTAPVTTSVAAPSSTPPPATSSAPPAADPISFTWSVHVSGSTVTLDGTWTGTSRTLTAADIASHVSEASTGAEAGSGITAFDGELDHADGSGADEIAPAGVQTTNGGILTECSGAPVAQHRTFERPVVYRDVSPGSYVLTMKTNVCGSTTPITDTATFTVAGPTFVPIVEPWDPGHAAQTTSTSICTSGSSTMDEVACEDARAENLDVQINQVQAAAVAGAKDEHGQGTINHDDGRWLDGRTATCAALPRSGGSIDQVDAAACAVEVSTARLAAVLGEQPAVTALDLGAQGPGTCSGAPLGGASTTTGTVLELTCLNSDGEGGMIATFAGAAGYEGSAIDGTALFSFVLRGGVGTLTAHTTDGHSANLVGPGGAFTLTVDFPEVSYSPSPSDTDQLSWSVDGHELATW